MRRVPCLLLPLMALHVEAVVFLGSLTTIHNEVEGRVAALSSSSLLLTRFSYDGAGPSAAFLVGTSGSPGDQGTILSYPWDGAAYSYNNPDAPIIQGSFSNEDVILHLPDTIRAEDVTWLSVWDRSLPMMDLGSVQVPGGIDYSSLTKDMIAPRLSTMELLEESEVRVGALSEKAHGVKGSVSFTSPSNIVISKFSYDGLGPQAFFIVGTSDSPGESGTILSYPSDGKSYDYFDQQAPIIRRSFNNEEVMLTLPSNISADQVAWMSVWCRQFSVDFGSVMVRQDLDLTPLYAPPRRPEIAFAGGLVVSVGALSEKAHGVMGHVSFTSPSKLIISEFSYDGLGPQAFFMVGTSGSPGESGTILSYPADGKSYDYFDQQAPIIRRSFDNEEVMLILPSSISGKDVAWVSVWCRQFSVDFGSVMVRQEAESTPLETQPSTPVTPQPTTTRRPSTTKRPITTRRPTTTRRPVIVPSNSVGVWQEVVEEPIVRVTSSCFSYMAGRPFPLIPGVLNSLSARLVLPQPVSSLAVTLASPALMVEAYTTTGQHLGKLTSEDTRNWVLLLETQDAILDLRSTRQQDVEVFLHVTVSAASQLPASRLEGLSVDGVEVADCAGWRRQATVSQAPCVTVDMAVYGNNLAFVDNVSSPLACWEVCQRLAVCRFWNHNMYDPATVERTGKVGRCHIKSSRGKSPGTVEGYTFGARGCRPL